MLEKKIKRQRRHNRVRARVIGTVQVPRFCVFRSNSHIYGQLIDDEKGKTIISGSDKNIKISKPKSKDQNNNGIAAKTAIAFEVGKFIAKEAIGKKIEKVVFDRAGYKYHGRIKAMADGAREGGLKF